MRKTYAQLIYNSYAPGGYEQIHQVINS